MTFVMWVYVWYSKSMKKATNQTILGTHLKKYEHLPYLSYNTTGPQIMLLKYKQRQKLLPLTIVSFEIAITGNNRLQQTMPLPLTLH